jgi:hypothetical protein
VKLSKEHRLKHKQPTLTEEQHFASTKLNKYKSFYLINNDEDDGYDDWKSSDDEVKSEELLHKMAASKHINLCSTK